jgi:hypothetical protein
MVAYTGIQGQNILIVSSDPSNPTEGQIWYNSTSNLLKGYANVVTNAWASGGNLPTARNQASGAGTLTAGLIFGGYTGSYPYTTSSLSYDGSAWTSVGSLSNSRANASGCGVQTAALAIGGYQYPPNAAIANVELYNGTSWTAGGSLNTARYNLAAAGISTAAVAFAGNNNATELYNGTSWTSNPTTTTPRQAGGGFGIQTAAVYAGGSGESNLTENFNGTTWTSSGNLNTGRGGAAGTSGTQTAGLLFGGKASGAPPYSGATEFYNGTSWTSNPTGLATTRQYIASSVNGTQAAAWAAGGDNPSNTAVTSTEEWTGSSIQVRTITTS